MNTSSQLKEWDLKHVWHPYCQMKAYSTNQPIIMDCGNGCTIKDLDGNQYIDTIAGLWNVNLGYGNKELIEVVTQQIAKLPYVNLCNFTHAPAIELAKKLVEILPQKLSRIFYCNSGAEGNETAIKMARQYHRQNGNPLKIKVLSFSTGYHGTTFGALSATGNRRDRLKFEPLLSGFIHLPAPQIPESPWDKYEMHCRDCMEHLERVIENERAETIAAILIEPILGCGGVQKLTKSYVRQLREICDQHHITLIFDEVVTAFGRTGHMFVSEYYDIVPDILVMSKGITSGYLPLGAVAAQDKIFQAFWSDDRDAAFLHGFTSSGNPVCCAVALRTIEIIQKERLCQRTVEIGDYFLRAISEKCSRYESIRDIRGIGLMIGIEFCDVSNNASKPPPEFVPSIVKNLMRDGIIMRTLGSRNNVIVLMPPLIITREDVNQIVEKFQKVVLKVQSQF